MLPHRAINLLRCAPGLGFEIDDELRCRVAGHGACDRPGVGGVGFGYVAVEGGFCGDGPIGDQKEGNGSAGQTNWATAAVSDSHWTPFKIEGATDETQMKHGCSYLDLFVMNRESPKERKRERETCFCT